MEHNEPKASDTKQSQTADTPANRTGETDKPEGWLKISADTVETDGESLEQLQDAHREHGEHLIGGKIFRGIKAGVERAHELGEETFVIPIEIASSSYWLPDFMDLRQMSESEKSAWRKAVNDLANTFMQNRF